MACKSSNYHPWKKCRRKFQIFLRQQRKCFSFFTNVLRGRSKTCRAISCICRESCLYRRRLRWWEKTQKYSGKFSRAFKFSLLFSPTRVIKNENLSLINIYGVISLKIVTGEKKMCFFHKLEDVFGDLSEVLNDKNLLII